MKLWTKSDKSLKEVGDDVNTLYCHFILFQQSSCTAVHIKTTFNTGAFEKKPTAFFLCAQLTVCSWAVVQYFFSCVPFSIWNIELYSLLFFNSKKPLTFVLNRCCFDFKDDKPTTDFKYKNTFCCNQQKKCCVLTYLRGPLSQPPGKIVDVSVSIDILQESFDWPGHHLQEFPSSLFTADPGLRPGFGFTNKLETNISENKFINRVVIAQTGLRFFW